MHTSRSRPGSEDTSTRDRALSDNAFIAYDFVEVVSIYWFLTEDDLIARKFFVSGYGSFFLR